MSTLVHRLIALATPALFGATLTTSHAQISTFTDEAVFTATTGQNTAIEFEEAAPRGTNGDPAGFFTATNSNGQFQRDAIFSVSPGDTSQTNYGIANINDVDYYKDVFGTPYNLGSGDFVSVFAPNHTTPVTLTMLFSDAELGTPPANAVGFRVGDFDGNGALVITAYSFSGASQTIHINETNGSYGFVGFLDTTSNINSITVTGDTGNPTPGFTFDHVLYSRNPVGATPAPSSVFTLLMGGIPGAIVLLRRRKRGARG